MQRPGQTALSSLEVAEAFLSAACFPAIPHSAGLLNSLSHLLHGPLPHTQDRSRASAEENDESNAREDSRVVNITRSEGAQEQNLEKPSHSMQYRTKIPRKLKYYYYHVSKQES